jgi:hypothetical protein
MAAAISPLAVVLIRIAASLPPGIAVLVKHTCVTYRNWPGAVALKSRSEQEIGPEQLAVTKIPLIPSFFSFTFCAAAGAPRSRTITAASEILLSIAIADSPLS